MAKNSTKTKKTTTKAKTATKRPKKFKFNLLPRQMIGIALAVAIVLTLGWLVVDRINHSDQKNGRIQIVTTFYPLHFFAEQIAGEQAKVINLTPAGADAHDFEPTPGDLTVAYAAELFIYNSQAMEPWVGKFLGDYRHTAIEVNQDIQSHHHSEDHDHDDHDHDHGHDHHGHDHANDPHTWTDPVLAQEIVKTITQAIIQADPDNQAIYNTNSQALISKLNQLDQDFTSGLAQCQKRTIITSHAAFSYLAERYNIEVLPISGLSPEQEPNAAKLAELKQLVNQKKIDYIFFEHQASPQLAQTLASETGAKLAILDPVESLSAAALERGDDYLTVQRSNLANLRTALACR